MSGCHPTDKYECSCMTQWESACKAWQMHEARISKLEKDILCKSTVEKWKEYYSGIASKKPHKCPVCNGYGYHEVLCNGVCVPGPECKACEGKGLVWG